MLVNLDVMYGFPGETLSGWESTIFAAIRAQPDSISTYFLGLSDGTALHRKSRDGVVRLPSHADIQHQHILSTLALNQSGYTELPSDYFVRDVSLPCEQTGLPSDYASILGIGPGSRGFLRDTQFCNQFDMRRYREKVEAEQSPIWRALHMNAAQMFHRDVMFGFKTSLGIDRGGFRDKYGRDPLTAFESLFTSLCSLGITVVDGDWITLTGKGRLLVEEVSALFTCPDIEEPKTFASRQEAHALTLFNSFSSYPPLLP